METSPKTEHTTPILLAEMGVQFTIDGRLVSAPASVFQLLWPSPRVIVKVSDVPRDPQPLPKSTSESASKIVRSFPLTSEGPSTVLFENGMQVKVVPSSWLFSQQDAEIHLQESPSVVLDSGDPIVRLDFSVLNFTNDVLNWPLPLQAPPWHVRIDPIPHLTELQRVLRIDSGYAVTNRGTIHRSDGGAFSKDDANVFLRGLEHFLSFVCGTECAISNVTGFDSEGNEAWKRWGSYHISTWSGRRSWSDVTIRAALAEVFGRYWQNYCTTQKHLDRILGWYVHSNETGALDVSIILNQSVLELLTTLTLGEKGNTGGMGKRIANMLRQQKIPLQIPDYCKGLITLAEKYGFEHGPHTIVEIRNSMVHSKSTLQINSLDVYHEAKHLGLWYVELLLLRMFEYTGEYACRLTDVQVTGATESLPWA